MRLLYTPTSPFVRKVRIAAHELGLADRLTLEYLRPSPLAPDATLSAHNPLSKIPALVTDDGQTLFDSRVIVEYLDTLHDQRPLIPPSGRARFEALRTQALADGMLDAGILVFYERLQRPLELQWSTWLDGQSRKVIQALDALENLVTGFGPEVDIAQIATAAAIGWLDFRQVVGDFRPDRPRLAAWFEAFSARPSMLATVPTA
jgi:glutathione S-transferase